MKKLKVGDKVITLKDEMPYYSGYAGNPVVIIPQGSVGIVGAVNVPYVFPTKDRTRGDYFVCVDFVIPDKFQGNPERKNNTWRCGINPKNIRSAK